MSTPHPMLPSVNPNDDLDDFDSTIHPHVTVVPALSSSSQSELDPIAKPSEDELNKQFSVEVAKLLIGVCGGDAKLSDEGKRMVLVDLRMRTRADMQNIRYELEKAVLDPRTPAALKLANTVYNSLDVDGGPDEDPERTYETIVRQILTKDMLRDILEIECDDYNLLLANPPASDSIEDRQRYAQQLACVSKMLGVFNEAGYRPDHPGCLLKLLKLVVELESYGPCPSLETVSEVYKYGEKRYEAHRRLTSDQHPSHPSTCYV